MSRQSSHYRDRGRRRDRGGYCNPQSRPWPRDMGWQDRRHDQERNSTNTAPFRSQSQSRSWSEPESGSGRGGVGGIHASALSQNQKNGSRNGDGDATRSSSDGRNDAGVKTRRSRIQKSGVQSIMLHLNIGNLNKGSGDNNGRIQKKKTDMDGKMSTRTKDLYGFTSTSTVRPKEHGKWNNEKKENDQKIVQDYRDGHEGRKNAGNSPPLRSLPSYQTQSGRTSALKPSNHGQIVQRSCRESISSNLIIPSVRKRKRNEIGLTAGALTDTSLNTCNGTLQKSATTKTLTASAPASAPASVSELKSKIQRVEKRVEISSLNMHLNGFAVVGVVSDSRSEICSSTSRAAAAASNSSEGGCQKSQTIVSKKVLDGMNGIAGGEKLGITTSMNSNVKDSNVPKASPGGSSTPIPANDDADTHITHDVEQSDSAQREEPLVASDGDEKVSGITTSINSNVKEPNIPKASSDVSIAPMTANDETETYNIRDAEISDSMQLQEPLVAADDDEKVSGITASIYSNRKEPNIPKASSDASIAPMTANDETETYSIRDAEISDSMQLQEPLVAADDDEKFSGITANITSNGKEPNASHDASIAPMSANDDEAGSMQRQESDADDDDDEKVSGITTNIHSQEIPTHDEEMDNDKAITVTQHRGRTPASTDVSCEKSEESMECITTNPACKEVFDTMTLKHQPASVGNSVESPEPVLTPDTSQKLKTFSFNANLNFGHRKNGTGADHSQDSENSDKLNGKGHPKSGTFQEHLEISSASCSTSSCANGSTLCIDAKASSHVCVAKESNIDAQPVMPSFKKRSRVENEHPSTDKQHKRTGREKRNKHRSRHSDEQDAGCENDKKDSDVKESSSDLINGIHGESGNEPIMTEDQSFLFLPNYQKASALLKNESYIQSYVSKLLSSNEVKMSNDLNLFLTHDARNKIGDDQQFCLTRQVTHVLLAAMGFDRNHTNDKMTPIKPLEKKTTERASSVEKIVSLQIALVQSSQSNVNCCLVEEVALAYRLAAHFTLISCESLIEQHRSNPGKKPKILKLQLRAILSLVVSLRHVLIMLMKEQISNKEGTENSGAVDANVRNFFAKTEVKGTLSSADVLVFDCFSLLIELMGMNGMKDTDKTKRFVECMLKLSKEGNLEEETKTTYGISDGLFELLCRQLLHQELNASVEGCPTKRRLRQLRHRHQVSSGPLASTLNEMTSECGMCFTKIKFLRRNHMEAILNSEKRSCQVIVSQNSAKLNAESHQQIDKAVPENINLLRMDGCLFLSKILNAHHQSTGAFHDSGALIPSVLVSNMAYYLFHTLMEHGVHDTKRKALSISNRINLESAVLASLYLAAKCLNCAIASTRIISYANTVSRLRYRATRPHKNLIKTYEQQLLLMHGYSPPDRSVLPVTYAKTVLEYLKIPIEENILHKFRVLFDCVGYKYSSTCLLDSPLLVAFALYHCCSEHWLVLKKSFNWDEVFDCDSRRSIELISAHMNDMKNYEKGEGKSESSNTTPELRQDHFTPLSTILEEINTGGKLG